MRLFAQLTKVDAAKRLVYGRACQEVVDHVGEVFDYAKSKPHFVAWSEECAKDTDGKSLGNVRAMHGKVAAGKLTAIDFNDAEKAIDVAAKVVDDNEWNKVLEGVYTGFSIGGSYIGEKITEKVNGAEVVRYVAKPNEISLVDQPCVPTAKFFDIVKADGAIEKVAFKPAALEVQGTDAEVAELAAVMQKGGLTMADVLALAKGGKLADIVNKGMWNVQDFAAALSSISYIAAAAADESEWEGDKSPIPEKLRAWVKAGADIFKAMAKEEADELVASLKGKTGKAAGIAQELLKLARLAPADLTAEEIAEVTKAKPAELAKALTDAGVAKASKATMQAVHDMVAELGGKCAEKAAPTGDVQKALATALERIEKLEKQPVPHVALRMVTATKGREDDKGNTNAALQAELDANTVENLTDAEKIKNADGSIDYGTSLYIKHQKIIQARAA